MNHIVPRCHLIKIEGRRFHMQVKLYSSYLSLPSYIIPLTKSNLSIIFFNMPLRFYFLFVWFLFIQVASLPLLKCTSRITKPYLFTFGQKKKPSLFEAGWKIFFRRTVKADNFRLHISIKLSSGSLEQGKYRNEGTKQMRYFCKWKNSISRGKKSQNDTQHVSYIRITVTSV